MSGPKELTILLSPFVIKSELAKFIKNLKFNLPNKNSKDLPPYLKKVIPHASRDFLE
jgi:hypothetical protein